MITSITKEAMIAVIHDEPKFSELFMAYLLTRNSRVEEDLIDQLFNSSEKRLARLLLLLAHFGKEGRPQPILLDMSQETLAEMIGTTRSRVSYFMNKFRKLGLISYNGKIEVHNSLLNAVLHENERRRRVDGKARPGRREGAHHDAVDQHLEVLVRPAVVAALGGVEGDDVGAGGPAGDALAERAGLLEEADLDPLGGGGIAGGEAAAVGRHPGRTGERPRRAGRVVEERAVRPGRPGGRLLEPRVGDRGRPACATATASMKAVLSPPAESSPWKVIVCDPAATVNAAVRVGLVRRAGGGEGATRRCRRPAPRSSGSAPPVVAALGGVEGDDVGAGGPAGDRLAERAAVSWRKPTWTPSGAGGLPEVKPLPLTPPPHR